MKLRTLILIMALLCLVWGMGFLLFPLPFWALYGLTLDEGGVYMARQLGVVFGMLGLILWLARHDPGSIALRGIVLGLCAGNVLGFVVALYGQLTAGISALGWLGVATYLLLALGFGYYLVKPTRAQLKVGGV
jgi:hypothetical protein